jgi:uncharacterized protein (TIGR02246 family)
MKDAMNSERDTEHDDAGLSGLVKTFVQGWNAGSGEQLARAFAPDADFTNVMGLRAHGRDVIARGHDEILATVFRATQLDSTINQIRYLRPDVAVVDVTLTLRTADGQPFAMLPAGQSSAGLVATRESGTWTIAVFRNMIPFARPAAGAVERSLTRDMDGRPQ